MNDDMMGRFGELESLLNWSPDDPITEMGQVEKHLSEAREVQAMMQTKIGMATIAAEQTAGSVATKFGPFAPETLNIMALASLVVELGREADWCMVKDIVLMETFLDAFAGKDRAGE